MATDPYRYFRVEAHEIVGELAQGLAELETRGDAALVTRLLRLAHTLKGAARIVRHAVLAALAHELETVARAAALGAAGAAPRSGARGARPDGGTGPGTRRARRAGTAAGCARGAAARAARPSRDRRRPLRHFGGPRASSRGYGASDDPAAGASGFEQLELELGEVRRGVESLRLTAAGSSYAALERTVRDAATLAGKRVQFTFEGGDVRIDGQVLAVLHGALVQLARNAVVHGIEPPAVRAAAGKPADGRVALVARARGTMVSVACEDDGRGLDLAAIRAAAELRGQRVAPDLGAHEVFQLLLRGGISTATEITQLSGRGIGLDLVRDAVQQLGGEVAVTTGPSGTSITLTVPVSVAAVPAVHVAVADRVGRDPAVRGAAGRPDRPGRPDRTVPRARGSGSMAARRCRARPSLRSSRPAGPAAR